MIHYLRTKSLLDVLLIRERLAVNQLMFIGRVL